MYILMAVFVLPLSFSVLFPRHFESERKNTFPTEMVNQNLSNQKWLHVSSLVEHERT